MADVQEVAQEHSVAAIKTLASIMAKAKAPAAGRIAAASALLDRGYGKPLQAVHAENTNAHYAVSDKPMSDEEWTETFVTEH